MILLPQDRAERRPVKTEEATEVHRCSNSCVGAVFQLLTDMAALLSQMLLRCSTELQLEWSTHNEPAQRSRAATRPTMVRSKGDDAPFPSSIE